MSGLSLTHKKIDSNLEKIVAHLATSGSKALSETLQNRLDKIDFADNLIRNGRSPKQVLVFLQKRFKDEEISRATAYRYIADSKYVYGSISREDKEYWKGVLIDFALETRSSARQAGDHKTMATCELNISRFVGLDKDDTDLPPLDKLIPPIQVLHIGNTFIAKYEGILPPEILKMAKKAKVEPTVTKIEAKQDDS